MLMLPDRQTSLVSRIIYVIIAVLCVAVLVGGIILFRSPKPLPCYRYLSHLDYLRPPANEAQRQARKRPYYVETGFGCGG